MVLGSEHYLRTRVSDEFQDPPADGSETSSPPAPAADPETSSPPAPAHGLMRLLSGAQRRPKQRRNTRKTGADAAFDAADDRSAQRANSIAALEHKFHAEAKAVSIADFLRPRPEAPPPQGAEPWIDPALAPAVVDLTGDAAKTGAEEWRRRAAAHEKAEAKASRTVAARDLFAAFAPQKPAKTAHVVTLRVAPARLAAVAAARNTRGAQSAGNGSAMRSASARQKPTFKVVLPVPSGALAEISKSANPLYTRSSGPAGKSASSVFAMMMQNSQGSGAKLSAIQKLKGLEPPPLARSEMHVTGDGAPRASVSFRLPLRVRTPPKVEPGSLDSLGSAAAPPRKASHTYTRRRCLDTAAYVDLHAPLSRNSAPHQRIYEDFILTKKPHSHSNWPQRFQPHSVDALLMDAASRDFINTWISNAFQILKTQSLKVPRTTKIKENQRRQRKREASFVADDFEEDDTDEEIFVPILIVQGDAGSCKSASIYAAMTAMDGYVHEINTGQQRARKDILSSLKEFCTTQIIHQNHDEKKFQKGVVLFEDCDILFEQDKTFWTVVQDVINFSRRPIVVTVRDLDVVPRNILELAEEQHSILAPTMLSEALIKEYLWLCSFSENCSLSSDVLDRVLYDCRTETGHDLRKALMECQWLCYVGTSEDEIMEIETAPEETPSSEESLAALAEKLDTLSFAEVLENNTHSSALHEVQMNELLDTYIIDETLHLRQKTLPHELNTGNVLQDLVSGRDQSRAGKNLTFNELRNEVLDFLASRAKKLPKLVQNYLGGRVTRLNSAEAYAETQGLPETSVCYSMSRQALIQDLAPAARHWARFQRTIEIMDREKESTIQEFLGWRRFHAGTEKVLATFS